MLRTTFITSIATAAIIAAAPAAAGPGGGHGGGGGAPGGGAGGPAGAMGAMQGGPGGPGAGGGLSGGLGVGLGAGAGSGPMSGGIGATVRDTARSQSQGPANASPQGLGHANQNSVLNSAPTTTTRTSATGARPSGTAVSGMQVNSRIQANTGVSARTNLNGVTTGTAVVNSSGATVGTVTGISTRGNGSIRDVQVTLTNGQVVTLSPQSLSLSGGRLTTNSVTTNVRSQGAAHASINGLTHASPNSALARAGVSSLAGLTTGLNVNNSAGTKIGTVSNVFTNRTGAVVGVQVSLNGGGTITLPATSLSMSGTTVVTSSTSIH